MLKILSTQIIKWNVQMDIDVIERTRLIVKERE